MNEVAEFLHKAQAVEETMRTEGWKHVIAILDDEIAMCSRIPEEKMSVQEMGERALVLRETSKALTAFKKRLATMVLAKQQYLTTEEDDTSIIKNNE